MPLGELRMGTEGILITAAILLLIGGSIMVSVWAKNHLAYRLGQAREELSHLKSVQAVMEKQMDHLKEQMAKVEAKFEITNGSLGIIATNSENHAKATEKLCDNTTKNFHTMDKSICRIHDKLDNFKLECAKYA